MFPVGQSFEKKNHEQQRRQQITNRRLGEDTRDLIDGELRELMNPIAIDMHGGESERIQCGTPGCEASFVQVGSWKNHRIKHHDSEGTTLEALSTLLRTKGANSQERREIDKALSRQMNQEVQVAFAAATKNKNDQTKAYYQASKKSIKDNRALRKAFRQANHTVVPDGNL